MSEIGQVMCDQGDYNQAEPLLVRSLELAQATGDWGQEGSVLTVLGRLAYYRGEHGLARERFIQALTSHQQAHEHGVETADILEWFALLEAAQAASESDPNGYRRATLMLSASDAGRKLMGAPVPPIKQQSQTEAVEALRTQLGESFFSSAWAEGQAMTLEGAVDYALRQV